MPFVRWSLPARRTSALRRRSRLEPLPSLARAMSARSSDVPWLSARNTKWNAAFSARGMSEVLCKSEGAGSADWAVVSDVGHARFCFDTVSKGGRPVHVKRPLRPQLHQWLTSITSGAKIPALGCRLSTDKGTLSVIRLWISIPDAARICDAATGDLLPNVAS